jgi:hypothetical protein
MFRWKKERLFLVALSLLLAMLALLGWEYNKARDDLVATQVELSQAIGELNQRNAEAYQLELELTSLKNQYNSLQNNYDELESSYGKLRAEHAAALAELEQSLAAPYTSISGREVTWAWKDMDGKLHKWRLPIDGYRSWIEKPKPQETLSLERGDRTYTIVDFRPYVRTDGFSKVVPNFYRESADEMVFAREMFNMVSQLTVYSEDIGEVARWPVETLTEAGGDCEDLAILFASLLKAAPYPYKLSLVYMDSDNPTNPQRPNHVIVRVEAADWRVFVEVTSAQGWGYYQRVVGWYYKL